MVRPMSLGTHLEYLTMTTRMSARELAAAFANAKAPATRAELRTYCATRAKESDRIRWTHLLAAIDAGDKARIAYHAASGDAKREAAKALKPATAKAATPAPAKPATPAKATPKPKLVASTPKPAPAKAAPASSSDPIHAAAKALGIAPAKLAAFVALLKA